MNACIQGAFTVAVLAWTRLACAGRDAPAPATLLFQSDDRRVSFELTAEPFVFEPPRDLLVTMRFLAPTEIEFEDPDFEGRLQGFACTGHYRTSTQTAPGYRRIEHHFRLTPSVAVEHRLGPMALAYTDHSRSPPLRDWIRTPPILLAPAPPGDPSPVAAMLDPVSLRDPQRSRILLWAAAFALAVCGTGLALRRASRRSRGRPLPPPATAQSALAALAAKTFPDGKPAQTALQVFYPRLTSILRDCMEQRFGLPARRQTTRELLSMIGADDRFPAGFRNRLAVILQSADQATYSGRAVVPQDARSALRAASDLVECLPGGEAEMPQPQGEGHAARA